MLRRDSLLTLRCRGVTELELLAERDALVAECAALLAGIDTLWRIVSELGAFYVQHPRSVLPDAVARAEAAIELAEATVKARDEHLKVGRHLAECGECDSVAPGCPQGIVLYTDMDAADDVEATALAAFRAASAACKAPKGAEGNENES